MSGTPRLGAYVLAGDPTWLRSSLTRYYDRLDALVISAPESGRGWTGKQIAATESAESALSIDTRDIARVSRGEWQGYTQPMLGETAQRQAAVDELSSQVDWILQIDTDEVLPDPTALLRMIAEADRRGIDSIEWPMRVLYRRLRDGRYLQVVGTDGTPNVEFPGAVAVRAGTKLVEARRAEGAYLRPHSLDHQASLQLRKPVADGEVRLPMLQAADAIVHNSWARPIADVRAKIASWGHNQGWRSQRYFVLTWLPAPLRWRRMHHFHPFAYDLWPALGECDIDVDGLLVREDR